MAYYRVFEKTSPALKLWQRNVPSVILFSQWRSFTSWLGWCPWRSIIASEISPMIYHLSSRSRLRQTAKHEISTRLDLSIVFQCPSVRDNEGARPLGVIFDSLWVELTAWLKTWWPGLWYRVQSFNGANIISSSANENYVSRCQTIVTLVSARLPLIHVKTKHSGRGIITTVLAFASLQVGNVSWWKVSSFHDPD